MSAGRKHVGANTEAVELACYDLFDIIKPFNTTKRYLTKFFLLSVALNSISIAIKFIITIHV